MARSARLLLLILLCEGNLSTGRRKFLQNNNEKITNSNERKPMDENQKINICNHSDTCSEINQLSPSYRDLRTRNCMCDDKCSLYNDCCKDSKFQAKSAAEHGNFSCKLTSTNGYIYMKTTCPPSWNQSIEIKENCESTNHLLLTLDVWLLTPVTTPKNDFVYKNMFCAFCNGVKNVDFWKIGFFCEPKEWFLNTHQHLPELDDILSKLRPIEIRPGFWESVVKNTTYHCSLHGKLKEGSGELRYCVPTAVDICTSAETPSLDCSNYTAYAHVGTKVNKNNEDDHVLSMSPTCHRSIQIHTNLPYTVDIFNPHIVKVPRCHQIPKDTNIYHRICVEEKPTRKRDICINEKCLIHEMFHKNTDVRFLGKGTIFLKARGISYPSSEWIEVNGTGLVYVCGHYIPRTPFQELINTLDNWISEILIKLSIICLLLHLLIFYQLPQMKNLSGKNLAMFCFTLLVAFVCYEIGPQLPRCESTAVILHFSLLSCFTWSLVMSYDCWHSLCLATKQLRTPSGEHSTKFYTYCTICLVIPMLIVGVALYFEFASPDVIPCHEKLGYGKYQTCFISLAFGLITFFIVPASCMFLCNICFFAHTAFMIYYSQRTSVNPNTRNDFLVYTRLALMMGLTWTLGTLLFLTEFMVVGLMFSTMNMSQGILIFCAFSFRQKTLKNLLEKHKNNQTVAWMLKMCIRETTSDLPTQMTHIESSSE